MLFCCTRKTEYFFFRNTSKTPCKANSGSAVGQRARFIEHKRRQLSDHLKYGTPLDEDSSAGSVANTGNHRRGCCYDQCTGTGNHQDGYCTEYLPGYQPDQT